MMAGPRKNVLFISLEDANPWFGCYGHHQVSTPNIDDIASRATVFRHAYAQAAVCNPSRASLIMGLRPETTGVYGNFDEWRNRIPEATGTIPEHFHANGYRTVNVGKVVHSWENYRPTDPNGAARVKAMWETHLPDPEGEKPILGARGGAVPARARRLRRRAAALPLHRFRVGPLLLQTSRTTRRAISTTSRWSTRPSTRATACG